MIANNQKETYGFKFTGVFPEEATQEDVFERVASPVIDSCLAGYNGTIFAYGQTGTGKTFSITGVPKDPQLKGIMPRAFESIFK